MKSWKVHYMNKYPGCRVDSTEHSFDVFSQAGEHLVSLVKNGAGQWVDQSEEQGCSERHDLAPIPRDCRIWKLSKEGKIERDDQADEREKVSAAVFGKYGKVPSLADLVLLKNPKADVRSLNDKANYADVAPADAPKAPPVA